MQKAVHEMDELDREIDGLIAIVDFAGCGTENFNESVDRKIVDCLRKHFPEALHAMYIANANMVVKGLAVLAKAALPAATKSKVITLPANFDAARDRLRKDISKSCIPRQLGGTLDVPDADAYVKSLSKIDDVDLGRIAKRLSDQGEALISKDNMQLKGLQYSSLGAQKCMEIAGVRHKGVLLWRKEEGESGGLLGFGLLGGGKAWKRLIGVLRDDVFLLFDSTTSKAPTLIVSLDGASVRNADVESRPRGTFCFYVRNEGNAVEYCFAAKSEQDRMQWVHLVEMGKVNTDGIKMNIQMEEDYFASMNTDLLGLEDVDDGSFAPSGAPKPPAAPSPALVNQLASLGLGQQHQVQQRQQARSQPMQRHSRVGSVGSLGIYGSGSAKVFPGGVQSVQHYGSMWQSCAGEMASRVAVPPRATIRNVCSTLSAAGPQIVQVLDGTSEAICAARSAAMASGVAPPPHCWTRHSHDHVPRGISGAHGQRNHSSAVCSLRQRRTKRSRAAARCVQLFLSERAYCLLRILRTLPTMGKDIMDISLQ